MLIQRTTLYNLSSPEKKKGFAGYGVYMVLKDLGEYI